MAGYQQRRRSQSPGGSGLGAVVGFAVVIIAAIVLANKAGVFNFGGGGGGGSGGDSANVASGKSAAILAEARKYDDKSYVLGGGHPPFRYNGGGLDCSGLIDVAVLKVTGINEDALAADFKSSKHWTPIKFADAGPGDIMYILKAKHPGRDYDHVVIVVSNGGDGKLVIFEAYSSGVAQKLQIRVSSQRSHYSSYDGALRFKG